MDSLYAVEIENLMAQAHTDSVKKMWMDYHLAMGVSAPIEIIADSFSNNEEEADELADLVNQGIKRATAPALWSFEKTGAQLPVVGGIFVVLDWNRNAVCIAKTKKVSIIPFNEISEENAYREGEGDRSLEHWRRVHIRFYREEFEKLGLTFDESMPIVFEEFDRVFP